MSKRQININKIKLLITFGETKDQLAKLKEHIDKSITEGHPYNYYPRGRVEIKNGKIIIFLNPDINKPSIIKEIAEKITFGLYTHDALTPSVTSSDDAMSGVDSVKFVRVEVAKDGSYLTKSDLDKMAFGDATSATVPVDNENNYVVYAKVTDKAGNYAYYSSTGVVVDITAPKAEVSSNVAGTNDSPAYGDRIVTVTDENLASVIVKDKDNNVVASAVINEDGTVTISPDDNGFITENNVVIDGDDKGTDTVKVIIPNDDNVYEVIATDKSGTSPIDSTKVEGKSIEELFKDTFRMTPYEGYGNYYQEKGEVRDDIKTIEVWYSFCI